MRISKPGFTEELATKIVQADRCIGCGGCVIACPFQCLNLVNGKPTIINPCKKCGLCSKVCPQYYADQKQLEAFVFSRTKMPEESFGIHRRLAIARSKDQRIIRVSQDGGLTTTLLTQALERRMVDAAIVCGTEKNKPFYPLPLLASTKKQVLEAAGTRYSYSLNLLRLPDVASHKKGKIAFVGTPCQIRGIRKMQKLNLNSLTKPIKYLIGVMCSKSFCYEGLMKHYIEKEQGIKLRQVAKLNIKGKLIIETKLGKIIERPLSDIMKYSELGCACCRDFSSELADISVGGLGLEGWTFAVIRTPAGEELFDCAEYVSLLELGSITEHKGALDLLKKLSRKKEGYLEP